MSASQELLHLAPDALKLVAEPVIGIYFNQLDLFRILRGILARLTDRNNGIVLPVNDRDRCWRRDWQPVK
jgi:hypothetical protein